MAKSALAIVYGDSRIPQLVNTCPGLSFIPTIPESSPFADLTYTLHGYSIGKMDKKLSTLKGTDHTSEIARLKRIEGQVRGILKMVEDERYCIDILNQLKAVKSAISSVEKNIIDEHLNHCVHSAIKSGNPARTDEVMDEVRTLIKSLKS